ncbi:MAG: sigma-54-dependent Fis family transcriptional regulator [Caldiserica bacterium]|nr:sigma-54-dependent Fis family transcriptional regulator [Caldisericota bacterium]
MPLIILVEDDAGLRKNLSFLLQEEGFQVVSFPTAEEAEEKLREISPDLVITDLRLPGISGLEFVSHLKEKAPRVPVIIITAYATLSSAVEAIRLGARDYLIKPFHPEKVILSLKRILELEELKEENRWLKEELSRRDKFEEMIGKSAAMQNVYNLIEKIAPSGVPVLIVGESGTGKELVARAIHKRSTRKEGKFVPVNCGAIPETLIESELFGHEKGAFTGATEKKKGLLEISHGGTLFLDEVGDLPLSVQMKLLRFLQEREFVRVGGTSHIKVDTRIISATNKNLEEEIEKGNFRKDLYYRIQAVILPLPPPLKERKEDIPILVEHFLGKYKNEGVEKKKKRFSSEAMKLLTAYSWPGNVRELENVVRGCIALSEGALIDVDSLPPRLRKSRGQKNALLGSWAEMQKEFAERYIREILKEAGGNVSKASRMAGISRRHFYEKMKEYNIDPGEVRSSRGED